MDTLVFTPVSLVEILSQIDELSNYNIDVEQGLDGSIRLTVGDSCYEIATNEASEISVSKDVVEDIDTLDQEVYEDLIDSGYVETIESGLIKEMIKTLFVGGVARLTAKALKKDLR